MKTKGFSYDLENDLMFLKCLGCYRVTTKRKKLNAICRPLGGKL